MSWVYTSGRPISHRGLYDTKGCDEVNLGDLPLGLYDQLITEYLSALLDDGRDAQVRSASLDGVEAPQRFADHIGAIVSRALEGRELAEQLHVTNQILHLLDPAGRDTIGNPPRVLQAIGTAQQPAIEVEPDISLSAHDVLMNARGEPQLAPQLKKELASADGVDLIVAFVRWYGVRLLLDELESAAQRGAEIRLLTTTYTGSTERRALDELHRRGVSIKVSYDTETTRLHAKAWIFHRDSGFSTAYIGSSNLTKTALLDGREWNVRLSGWRAPKLFQKVIAGFDSQWASSDYELYDPARDADRLDQALQRSSSTPDDSESPLSGLVLRPWPYQSEILEALDVERRIYGYWRNLVVAPTGTGKTVVAALDYKRLLQQRGRLRLLFIAHRERILSQARRTFREALGDGSFGTMLVGGERPSDRAHVFASIQTLNSLGTGELDPSAFDMVIVDEFHHAEAATYRRWLNHLQPTVMLALTATPERTDGLNIRTWTDGRTAFDMRLWHALDRGLLSPFQYFGLADVADLAHVRWSGGQYSAADLARVYTADDARARLITHQVQRLIGNPKTMRALAFCATVEHAEFMTEVFNRIGWAAVSISGDTPQAERDARIRDLQVGTLTTIFTRDVFNEGIDIPEVDTILLLRPTESVTVYLQQIGRGLRRHPTKEVCTVLDFVAQYRSEYRFDLRLRALTGIARRDLGDAAKQGFPFLPSGCHIQLDRQAQEWVVEHVRHAVETGARALRAELVQHTNMLSQDKELTLRAFLNETGVELQDIAKAGGWTHLKRQAGLEPRTPSPHEAHLQRGLARWTYVDDELRIAQWNEWLSAEAPPTLRTERERRLASMLLISTWSLRATPSTFEAAWAGLWESAPLREELREILDLLHERIPRVAQTFDTIGLGDVPLQLGATYARDEILAAFGRLAPGKPAYSHQAGPWHDPASNTEVLFITLRKSPKHYSPQTLYRDYAISRDLFHWETPNDTRIDSTRGHRYLDQRKNGLRVILAVRESIKDPWGATAPYVLLGPAELVSHKGERPIGITWRLRNPIPADLYEQFKVAAA